MDLNYISGEIIDSAITVHRTVGPGLLESAYEISGEIIDSAITVHRTVGPGLLESAYEICLIHELLKKKLKVKSQVECPILYDGVKLDVGYRIDLLVENRIIVELKATEKILPIHKAQVLSYMKLSGYRLGLLLNFNELYLKDGIKRLII